jgi:hypothetical protein
MFSLVNVILEYSNLYDRESDSQLHEVLAISLIIN